ncbi:alpha,alpha-phosphotrehalase [Domibacillus sp. DTU_2020_1001157_1_SI_ALB_TIR_016]|uniref:alpha,alpha-phosphotrehalase n=1 Tax=Domibacillus sp. DTU_2020_1001157_1_SI_ALB_TIR_016 TaxID=3077789 RepID=UPI0028E41847|nr:alpha,alpha-phosphotrehalase [Domibacillus sp. DTU_2020_1001157_1_SI_ALB_TIR_016]WNS79873.1 alpha,alpha-phosphotrehalase [Domibacillus sp. DTU_2020_1001157_1_SI_ALB_TIR_016]
MNEQWWKQSVVYQIYPKSFNDTNGSGVGDLRGIIEKLDYLKDLGVDVLWLTPIYASPQKDNGYDISDYYAVNPEYGTMADVEELLEQAHNREIKIVMDLVVNHTSTEHNWFQQSREADGRFRDYYIWKDGVNGGPPNNWKSKFGGSAWAYDEKRGQYYLHLFDRTQADLNWENEQVRRDLYEMMHFWLQKGIDGFRLDVINLISKDQSFPDDFEGDGRRFYTDGPRVHEFLREMNDNVFSQYDLLTVGEMSSTTIEHCIRYSHPDSHELAMTFNFHHLKADYPGGEKWTAAPFDFLWLKGIMSDWQQEMDKGGGWNALFWCNHDQPRIVSRYGNDGEYRMKSAKMLANAIHFMKGTPYIYQGEEIGMTNPHFERIEQYRDVESLNMYNEMRAQGMAEEDIMTIIKQKSRDNSRTPVQWNSGKNAGFTSGTPWIETAENYKEINVETAQQDPDSIFYHYKTLIELRKKEKVMREGSYRLLMSDHPELFVYMREYEGEAWIVINNFYGRPVPFVVPEELKGNRSSLVLSNEKEAPVHLSSRTLTPYESTVYRLFN